MNENEPAESRLNLTDLNLIELNQDPDQCSEEPKANFAKKGKPRCIISLFSRYYSSNYSLYVIIIFICAFTFLGVDRNHSCMSLGTYVCYPDLFLN